MNRIMISLLLLSSPLLAQTPDQKTATLTVILFGDLTGEGSHERELLFLFTAKNGFTAIQQNRQTSDGSSAVGSLSGGWKFQIGKHFTQTTTAGPVFGYDPKPGYSGQIVVFSISNLDTNYFRVDSIVKLSIPTNNTVGFGDRHIQVIKGPSHGTPRFLEGVALDIESLHVNARGGRWLEFRVGPAVNVGEALGKSKENFWSRITVYPYRDFCRPQPGHSRLWDFRVQYVQTFHLGK